MSRFVAALLLLTVVLLPSTGASAETSAAVYARALHAFNPELDDRTSFALAGRLIAEADAQALDARLLVALIAIESDWHPGAISAAGAIGLGQLMPGTAANLGVDPTDPLANIHGIAVHLRGLLDRYGSYTLALAAYNAGGGAVDRYGGVPPYRETRRYVRAVILLWRRLSGAA